MRNHNTLSREVIIQTIASNVPTGHKVDLKDPTLSILVEVFKVICCDFLKNSILTVFGAYTGRMWNKRCQRLCKIQEIQRDRNCNVQRTKRFKITDQSLQMHHCPTGEKVGVYRFTNSMGHAVSTELLHLHFAASYPFHHPLCHSLVICTPLNGGRLSH